MDKRDTAAQFDLIRRAQNGEEAACEQLIEENSGLIWSVAHRFFRRGIETEDLYQLGCLGFVKAVKSFDCEFGTQFSTYAVPKIMGEIRRFLRDDGMVKVSRTVKSLGYQVHKAREQLTKQNGLEPTVCEIAEYLGISAAEIAACEIALQPTDSLQREIGEDGCTLEQMLSDNGTEDTVLDSIALKAALEQLEDLQRKVILLRYYRGQTQQKCAELLGVSQVQISRLERKAIATMRRLMEVDE